MASRLIILERRQTEILRLKVEQGFEHHGSVFLLLVGDVRVGHHDDLHSGGLCCSASVGSIFKH